MVLELLVVQVHGNCQGSGHQGQDFAHHNLVEMVMLRKLINKECFCILIM